MRRSFWNLSSPDIPDRPTVDFLAPQGSHLKRYSYKGFVDSIGIEELSILSLTNEGSS